tara:strand:+ start:70 stop:876 length:807 start_codon:yes stop_codon:yes gene_type:complete
MAKPHARRKRARRSGRRQTHLEAQSVHGIIIGRSRSDEEFAGSTYVPADPENNLVLPDRDTAVTWPRFDDGSSCAVEFRDSPVDDGKGREGRKRVAVPVRHATVGRRAEVYRPSILSGPIVPDAVESLVFPQVWTAEEVMRWMSHGLWVIRVLPMDHMFPADARAQNIPVVRSVAESYSYGEEPARETPDKVDIAIMDIVLAWPTLLDSINHRLAFLAIAAGARSAPVARQLGYKARQMGKKKAEEAATLIAAMLNADAGMTRREKSG